MIRGKALGVVVVLSSLLGTVFLLAAPEPVLANCCSSTCYAWSRRPDLRTVCTREAKYWDDDARQRGLTVGKVPRVGAIAVFEAGVQGADWGRNCTEAGGADSCSGHVAYVERVDGSVQFQVSEKGWSRDSTDCDVHTRTAYAGAGVSFIYETVQVRPDPVVGGSESPYANGTRVIQGERQGGNNQRWRFLPDGDYFNIVARHSGKCLEVSGGSHANGARVVQWDCYGGDNQRWRLVSVGEDVRFVAKHSGKCLDVSRSSLHGGAEIVQWDCHSGGNQLWKRVPEDGYATIIAKHSGRSLDVVGHPGDDDQPMPIGFNRQWRLVPEGPYYRIVAEHSDKCLDVSNDRRSNGVAVELWDCDGGDDQLWSFVPVGAHFKIVAKQGQRCLDVSEASPADGAAIIQWDCNGGENQLWTLFAEGEGYALVAKHSGRYLSVADIQSNGAPIVQWGYRNGSR